MQTFFAAFLAICAGNSPVPGDFPAQRPVTRSFDVFFDLRLNKRLRKQLWGWSLETLSRPLWRHCNATTSTHTVSKWYWIVQNLSRSHRQDQSNIYTIFITCTRWASCQIRKMAGCACARNAGNVSPLPRVGDPDMHFGACVTHVHAGIANWRFPVKSVVEKKVPGIPGSCATRNFTYLAIGP